MNSIKTSSYIKSLGEQAHIIIRQWCGLFLFSLFKDHVKKNGKIGLRERTEFLSKS